MALHKSLRIAAVLCIFVAALSGIHRPALAACTSPDGIGGTITWNGTDSVIWCDGTNWYALKNAAGSSGTAGYIQFSNGSGGFSNSGTTAGQQLFWDDTNKRLGIGTATPSAPLHLYASAGSQTKIFSNGIDIASNNTSTPILNVAGGSGADLLRLIGASSAPRLYVTSAGNVGIGTATPSYLLSLGGEAARTIGVERPTTATNGLGLTINAGGAKSGGTDLNGGNLTLTAGTSTGTGTSNIYFQTAAAGTTGTTDNTPSTAMTILGNNNVGIGTTAPVFKLHLLETSNAAETLPLHLQNAGTSNGTTVGISFTPASGSSTGAKITSNQVQNGNIALGFSTMGPTDGLTYRMYISGPGNVGIGTTSPIALLNLGGNRSLASWTTAGANFHVNATTLTDTSGSGTIATRVVNSFNQPTLASSNAVTLTDAATLYIAGAPIAGTNTTITNSLALQVATGASSFGGNVGILTTSPTYNLSFAGNNVRSIGVERNTLGFGRNLTINAGGAKSGDADLNGGDLSLSSGTATGTGSSNIYFQTATAGATATTDRTPTTKMAILGNGNVGIGTTSAVALLHLSGNKSAASWTTTGINLAVGANTLTDTTGSGAISVRSANSFGQPTFASTNVETLDTATTLWIASPAAGTNTTITSPVAAYLYSANAGLESMPLFVRNDSSTNGTSAAIGFGAVTTNGVTSGKISNVRVSATNFGLAFSTSNGTLSEAMRITGAGYVGIGTTTPAAKLDVNGFMRLAKNGSAPATCDATIDGAIALTSARRMCVCDATNWVEVNSATACTW